jgi:hypothetical protein
MAHYFRSTGANWGTIGDWSSTPSPIYTAVAAVPTAADDVIFEPASNNCIVNASARVCKSINFTGYTNILTMQFGITVSGNVTFIATQSSRISGSGVLTINAASTITSNGGTWPNGLTFTGPITVTLADNLTVTGTTTTQTNTVTFNTNTFNIQGNLTANANTAGTTTFIINGSGTTTWSGGGRIGNNLTINKTGNVTITGTVYFGNSKTLTYTAVTGTFTTTGSTLRIPNTNAPVGSPINLDLNAAGTGWNDFYVDNTVNNPTYVNLLSNASFNNYHSSITTGGGGSSSVLNTTASATLSVRGNYVQGTTFSGNSKVIMVGTGSITSSGLTSIDFEINSPSGIITFVSMAFGILIPQTRTLKYTAAGGGFITTGSTLSIFNTATLDLVGTSWGSLVMTSQVNNDAIITLSSNAIFSSILCNAGIRNCTINGSLYTIYCTGNVSINSINSIYALGGDSTLEFTGSSAATWAVTGGGIPAYTINIIVNKSTGALVTAGSTLTWGLANRTLTFNSPVDFSTNSNTFTLSGTPLTINNLSTPATQFFNMTVPNNATLNINGATTSILGTLLLSGNTTFAGTHGFSTQNFTCTVANSTITLQNINANPLAEYIVNGVLTLTGTAASRITLQAAGSATFNATITPVAQLNYLSGVVPAIGMTVSQATLASPAQLDPTNRPVITGGASPTFTITPAAGAIIGTSLSMRAGYKAKFTLTNGTGSQNVAYTTTQDIDSSAGATITSFGSYSDSIGQPSANLFRTLNWGPLIAPSGSVYYTFVN